MNEVIMILGILMLCFVGLKENSNEKLTKSFQLSTMVYKVIIVLTVVYCSGYQLGKLAAHMNL